MGEESNVISYMDFIQVQYPDLENDFEQMKDAARRLYFRKDTTKAERKKAFMLLDKPFKSGDYEAYYLIGRILIDGEFNYLDKNKKKLGKEYGWSLILESAVNSYEPAKHFLDTVTDNEYKKRFADNQVLFKNPYGPLKDFDGKEIKINRKGVFTPVDAVLEYKNGQNILKFSLNVKFLYFDDEISDKEIKLFKRSALEGIKQWEGDYSVFGGQKVKVKIDVTTEDRNFDNVTIIVGSDTIKEVMDDMSGFYKKVPGGKKKAMLFDNASALATHSVLGWSVTSRKKILCLPGKSGKFDDPDYVMHTIKHEFGHVLGLGDLYSFEGVGLKGVDKGEYSELDAYKIPGYDYHLVMSDAIGPISNNDIEMVILAFSENRMQVYQEQDFVKKVSEALGKGD